MFIKSTQISLFATLLLSFSVAVITLLANKELDLQKSKSLSKPHINKNTDQLAGGSATGNAIDPLAQALPDSQNSDNSHSIFTMPKGASANSAISENLDSISATDAFGHLFSDELIKHKSHYKSTYPLNFDIELTQDSLSAQQLLDTISQLRKLYQEDSSHTPFQKENFQSKLLKVGSKHPYSVKITGSLALTEMQNLSLWGLSFREGILIEDSQNIHFYGIEVSLNTSVNTSAKSADIQMKQKAAIIISQSSHINIQEAYLHHNDRAILINENDLSLQSNDEKIRIQRSILTHNRVALDIKNSYSIYLSNNFIAFNQSSIAVNQEKPVLMSISGAVSGYKNVFYHSPILNSKHLDSQFLDKNLHQSTLELKHVNSLAWFWLTH